jgi:hypothetical protein
MPAEIPITGTNHYQYVYDAWLREGGKCWELTLERDGGNPYDQWAVKVMFAGRQMGWIGKTHSQDIGGWLDRNPGHTFNIVETKVYPRNDPMTRVIASLVGVKNEYANRTPRTTHDDIIPRMPQGFEIGRPYFTDVFLFPKLQAGTTFKIFTKGLRASYDLLMPDGRSAGWFRKTDIDVTDHFKENWSQYHAVKRGNSIDIVHGPAPLSAPATIKTVTETRYGDTVSLNPANVLTGKILIDGSITGNKINPTPTINQKENTMNNVSNFFSRLFAVNTKAAGDAAVLEAGRLANNTITKIITDRLPFMARFYARTPFGKLAVANAAIVLVQQFRPNDPRLVKLTAAMATQAYQETYQMIDIEGAIDQLLAHPSIKRALEKTDAAVDTK